MKEEKLALAYFQWRKKKNFKNFRRMISDGFTGGCKLWRAWRVIKNTVSGKYERTYQEYWKGYDIDVQQFALVTNQTLNQDLVR